MAVNGTLYGVSEDSRTSKILIAAKYSEAKVTLKTGFKLGETNKSPEFLKKFPHGKVPAFETSSGETIYESNAISWLVSNEQFRGKTPVDQAKVLQWVNFADNEISPAASTWVFPVMGIMPFNKNTTEKAKEDLKKALSTLNSYLLRQTYLVGERISLADISVCCSLLKAFSLVLDPELRKTYQNVTRWFMTIVNQPLVKSVLGDFKPCEKMGQFDGKKYAEFSGAAQKKEQKPKEKKEQAPKEEKKAPPPAPKEDKPAPKPKDPLDALPAGSFDMEDWKRFYSNNDEDKYMDYFWSKFDKEHYSLWFCDYKYQEELSKIFMTCNLVGGMYQRLDKLNKHAFASTLIFGDDSNNQISGVWMWKGHELVFPLSENWEVDYESYNWRKMDPANETDRKLVAQYWMWTGEDSKGRKINQGKVFK